MDRSSLAALSLVLGSSLLHCGGDQKPAEAPEPAVSMAPAELPPAPMSGPDAGAPRPDGASATPSDGSTAKADPSKPDTLDDDQIAAITDAANVTEVEQGKFARLKSKDPAVQKFAARMIAAHEEAKKNQAKLKLPTADSALGNSLGSESTSAMNAFKGLEGKDFDKAYIDAQVSQHQRLLDALNDKLIPSAKNPDLKAYLAQMAPHVARHLKEAQELQRTFPTKTAAVTGSDKLAK